MGASMVTRPCALLLGALVLVAPTTSAGRSVLLCPPPRGIELPAHGAEDVPTNARLWFDRQASFLGRRSELVLVGHDGMELETTQVRLEMFANQALVVLTPLAPLLPEARHQFWECDGPMCSTLISEFTTGTEADTIPPALPVETDREQGRDTVSLSFDFEGVLIVSLGDVALDPATLTGSAHSASTDSNVAFEDDCPYSWPGAAEDEQTLRYGAFDLAGNFSGWSEPEPLSLSGCGCSATNRSTPPLPLLVLLFGLTRRRSTARRRRAPNRSILRRLFALAQEREQQRHHHAVTGPARAALDLDQRR